MTRSRRWRLHETTRLADVRRQCRDGVRATQELLDVLHEDVNLIWGWVTDESMQDQVRVTVVATGFQEGLQAARPSAERQVAVKVANGGGRGQTRGPLNRELASGFDLRHDDYDIPTFFKHAD